MNLQDWLPDEISQDIWKRKYQFENESLEDWLIRITNDDEREKHAIISKKFIFGGRILANRGLVDSGKKVSYSNCYVISPPDDSLISIYECASDMARTFSYGGGVGVDISKLAPRGAKINNAAKTTSGSISFMDLFSLTAELIGQNNRRGAAMITLSCNHPDLMEFIEVKNNPNKVTKANISIRITDDFMRAVEDDKAWDMQYIRDVTGETITKRLPAREIFRKIAENNWRMAEPGILFWDRIKKHNLFSGSKAIEYAGVNPCAEQPLPAYGSCLLGSLNLSAFVSNPFTREAEFNFTSFADCVGIGVMALNSVLREGLKYHPLIQQQKCVEQLRQIGLGLCGWHDALLKLGIAYSDMGAQKKLINKIGSILVNRALSISAKLADSFGKYPLFDREAVMRSPIVENHASKETKNLIRKYGLAHSQILTVAPTGSVATMLGVSTALEPIYSISYKRKTESLHGREKVYDVFAPIVREYMAKMGIKDIKHLPSYFETAKTINYMDRIKVQSMWQEYIDSGISSTINVPNEFSVADVENLYMEAWKAKLKGTTIYRDGCEREGILSDETAHRKHLEAPRGIIKESPTESAARTYKLVTGCGNLYLTVGYDEEGNVIQTFTNKGSTGTCRSNQEALSRLISFALRGGLPIEGIVDQLKSVDICPSFASGRAKGKNLSAGSSCPYAMALTLEKANNLDKKKQTSDGVRCPECGESLLHEGGCVSCRNCSYSRCG